MTKVHVEVAAFSRAGRECVLIGHAGHPEVEGTMGRYDASNGGEIYLVEDENQVSALEVRDPSSLAFVTQTTLSVDDTAKVIDALREKFPAIQGPRKDDICYATQNRQDAVKALASEVDRCWWWGLPSSNSNRLRELAERCGASAFLIDDASMIDPQWLSGKQRIGVTAGASAPELLVQEVIDALQSRGGLSVRDLEGREENITFSLPKALRIPTVAVEDWSSARGRSQTLRVTGVCRSDALNHLKASTASPFELQRGDPRFMHRKRTQRSRRQNGFTLLETLLTLSLVAVLLSIGLPPFKTNWRMDGREQRPSNCWRQLSLRGVLRND